MSRVPLTKESYPLTHEIAPKVHGSGNLIADDVFVQVHQLVLKLHLELCFYSGPIKPFDLLIPWDEQYNFIKTFHHSRILFRVCNSHLFANQSK